MVIKTSIDNKYTRNEIRKTRMRNTLLKKYPINIDYFKKLNTRNAYTLGYLFADGHLRKDHATRMRLSFSSKDKELADKIKKEFGIENRIERINKNMEHDKWQDQHGAQIRTHNFLKHLVHRGMLCGKKTDRIIVPNEIKQKKYIFFAFLRGFFDGDGYVSSCLKSRVQRIKFTTASDKFLVDVKKYLEKIGLYVGKVEKSKTKEVYKLQLFRKNEIYNLYKLMYKNCNNLFLTRKKRRFEEFFRKFGWRLLDDKGIFEKKTKKQGITCP